MTWMQTCLETPSVSRRKAASREAAKGAKTSLPVPTASHRDQLPREWPPLPAVRHPPAPQAAHEAAWRESQWSHHHPLHHRLSAPIHQAQHQAKWQVHFCLQSVQKCMPPGFSVWNAVKDSSCKTSFFCCLPLPFIYIWMNIIIYLYISPFVFSKVYFIFTRMSGESYTRWFWSFLFLCDMLWVLINSVCWPCTRIGQCLNSENSVKLRENQN